MQHGQSEAVSLPDRPQWFLPGLLGLAMLLLGAAVLLAPAPGSVAAAAAGALAALVPVALLGGRRRRARRDADMLQPFEDLAEAMFVTDRSGRIRAANRAGRSQGGLDAALAGHPHPLPQAYVLARAALLNGFAHWPDGAARRPTVSVACLGADRLLWRVAAPADLAETRPALPLPGLRLDADDRVLGASAALVRMLGVAPADLASVLADLPLRPDGVHRLRPDGRPVRMVTVPVAGAIRDLYLLPLEPVELAGLVADPFLDRLPVALLRLGDTGEITYLNAAAQALLGPDAVPGAMLPRLIEGLGRPIDQWLRAICRGRARGGPEVARRLGPGEERFLQVAFSPVLTEGRPEILAVMSDATELKTLEAQFVQSQKMQAVGQLSGGIAHDFNNLLTAINGHCDLLLLRHEAGDPDHGDLIQIRQNANRAAALVRQLLAFSRKQTLLPRVIDLSETVADLSHLLNRLVSDRVTLVVDTDEDLWPVRADERQLEQVILNLVVNARDAMPEGGTVRLGLRNLTLDADLLRDRAIVLAGRYVLIEVADEGIGIPKDKLQKIFEPFYTTKLVGEGTGLGLSTAYGIVKQTGGFIFCDSAPGEGATFRIYLPAHEEGEPAPATPAARAADSGPVDAAPDAGGSAAPPSAPTDQARAQAEPPADGGGPGADEPSDGPGPAPTHPSDAALAPGPGPGLVLLVEDEAPVRAFAARALRLGGYDVLEAGSGDEALALLEDPGLQPDLVLSDVIMPGRDGPAWVAEARRTRPDLRVIFMSGYAETELGADTTGADRAPGTEFLLKPFSLTELTRRVAAALAP